MSNTTTVTEQELKDFKLKVQKLKEELSEEIWGLCEKMDYKDSSKFGFNIDRLVRFNDELQEFTPHD